MTPKKLWFRKKTAFAASTVCPLLALFLPALFRSIPEVLMGPYLVGFDTISYYVPTTLQWLNGGVDFLNFMAVAPFFYVPTVSAAALGVPVVGLLKLMGPLLLGLLGFAVYFYALKALAWSPAKSLAVALLATLYFVALRLSWDMLRTEIALIFLFATLIFLNKTRLRGRSSFLLSLLMVLVVLSHQLVSVIMLFIVALTLISLAKQGNLAGVRKLALLVLPALVLFAVIVYADVVTVPNFAVLSDFPKQSSAGYMALYGFNSYPDMAVTTLSFLALSYLPLIPLIAVAVKRFRGNLQLNAWILWIFIALSLALISPEALFPVIPYRWILLLTYPLAFFAVDGLLKINLISVKAGVMLFLVAVSLGFMLSPDNSAFPYYDHFSSYAPSPMIQNSIPLCDCQDTTNALQWAKTNLNPNGRLLVHDAFKGWAMLNLNHSQLVLYGYNNPQVYAQQLVSNGSTINYYLIWWVDGWGGHGLINVPSGFEEVYRSGNIAIYLYAPSGVLDGSDSNYSANSMSEPLP